MKWKHIGIITSLILISVIFINITGCPTCIAYYKRKPMPFFEDGFYRNDHQVDDVDYDYDQNDYDDEPDQEDNDGHYDHEEDEEQEDAHKPYIPSPQELEAENMAAQAGEL